MAELLIQRSGDTERWTLSDPATRNALSDAVVVALFEACLRAKQDDSLRLIVLTGASDRADQGWAHPSLFPISVEEGCKSGFST